MKRQIWNKSRPQPSPSLWYQTKKTLNYTHQLRRNLTVGTGHISEVTDRKQTETFFGLYDNPSRPILFQIKANFTDSLEFRRTLENEENTTGAYNSVTWVKEWLCIVNQKVKTCQVTCDSFAFHQVPHGTLTFGSLSIFQKMQGQVLRVEQRRLEYLQGAIQDKGHWMEAGERSKDSGSGPSRDLSVTRFILKHI